MIEDKLNIQSEIQKVIDAFKEKYANRTFSGRHPELGKMINCPICTRRHRASQVCHQQFVKVLTPPEGLTSLTKFQIFGRAAFAKKRLRPHHSKKLLQLIQRTQELFWIHYGCWPSTETKSAEQVAMEVVRREARAALEKEYHDKRSKTQSMQHNSCRINRGLVEISHV